MQTQSAATPTASRWGRKTPERRQIDDKRDIETAESLLAELLVKIGKTLGYDFDKVYIKNGWHQPHRAHSEHELGS
ncbi:MAG: DUF6680 family protein [Candidatus Korobacteraceae bacterium]